MILLSILPLFAMAPLDGNYNIVPPPVATSRQSGPAPLGNPGLWIQPNDYPGISMQNHEEGTVGFRLTISPSGLVANCEVTVGSEFPALDEATCRLVSARARFKPATDATGKPVEGYYSSRVRWKLPEGNGLPQAGEIKLSFVIEQNGSQTNCQVVRSNGTGQTKPAVGPIPCPTRRFEPPYTDGQGRRLRKRVTVTTTVTVEDAKE